MSALQKKSLIRVLLLLFSVLCLLSCEFSTNEVYDRDIKEDVQPPEISVIQLTLEQDSVFLFGNTENMLVSFRFLSSNQQIKAVKFLIDGLEMKTLYSGSGYFEYDQDNLDEGIHKLDIQIITGSESGSIASILGMEGFVFLKSWTLVVDKSYNLQWKSTIVNGLLQFSWKRYPGNDFIEYVIYRLNQYNTRVEAGRTTSPFFIDSTYVGEGGTYEVEVRQQKNGILPWGYLYMQKEIPAVSLTESEPGKYLIKWGESKYFSAVDSVDLYIRYNNYSSYVKVKSARNQSDYSYYLTDAAFNSSILAKIVLVQKDNVLFTPENYSSFESSEVGLRVGIRFNSMDDFVDDIFQTAPDEFSYLAGPFYLFKYSVTRKEIVEHISSPGCNSGGFLYTATSASGKYFTSYNFCDYDVMLINSDVWSDNTSTSLKPFSGQYYVPEIPVSDIKTVLVNSINEGFYIYDFKTPSSLAFYKGSGPTCKGLKISTEGNFIFLKDDSLRLVKFENSLFNVIWSHNMYDKAIKYYNFHGLNPDQLVIWNGAKFSVRLCSDFSLVYEFPLVDKEIQNIDYYNNRILTYSPGHLYVRSLTDGSLIKDVPIFFNALESFSRCFLIKNAIVCRSGYLFYYE